ncbi:ABC transporter ATP-binding protein/permease [Actinomycetaceae bacterium TAE3-ERU4]|nr:ABC transporter ATP-binding protein/permease [Actinomycetaceae bacterium TAE3-ERU4]
MSLEDENEKQADLKAQHKEGKKALASLLTPIRYHLLAGRALGMISGFLSIVPYIALVKLGSILLSAAANGQSPNAQEVSNVIIILVSAFCLQLLLYALGLLITHMGDLKFSIFIRQKLLERIGQMPLSWFSKTNSGKIRKLVHDDVLQIHVLIAHKPVDETVAMFMPVCLTAYAFIVDWRLGLLTISTLPIYIAAMIWMMWNMGEKTVEMDRYLGKVSSTTLEFVSGITVVKAFGKTGKAHRNYQEAADNFYDFYMDWTGPMMKGSAFAAAWIGVPVIFFVNLLGGGYLVWNAGVPVSSVLATSLIALAIPNALDVMAGMTWSYQIAGAAAIRIQEILTSPILEQDKEGNVEIPTENLEVEFDNVSYSYGENIAAKDISFTLKPGTVTALVGPSGSGKSTLAMLLARFNDPAQGCIKLGGVDLREYPAKELYKRVGFIIQDPQLLRASVKENISLAKPGATLEEIKTAAKAANINQVIENLEDGYETILGKDTALSGGERQRIAIARAILAQTPVLIMDEATAFADPESEAQIQDALNRLVEGRTVLVIAHRPESIRGADQILVLDRGYLVASGKHEELKDNPIYRRLWQQHRVSIDENAKGE